MTANRVSLQYKQAVTRQASVAGLVIALHDTLVGNLRRAAQAMEANDIPTRCQELIHGFKVLKQLEAMLDMENGGTTATAVHRFYAFTRGQMLKAQFTLSPSILWEQVQSVLEVRQAWHQLDSAPVESTIQRKSAYASFDQPEEGQERNGARMSFTCEG